MFLFFCWLTEFWTQSYLSLNNYEMPEITWSNVVEEIEKLIIYECQNGFKMCNLLLHGSYLMSSEMV